MASICKHKCIECGKIREYKCNTIPPKRCLECSRKRIGRKMSKIEDFHKRKENYKKSLTL